MVHPPCRRRSDRRCLEAARPALSDLRSGQETRTAGGGTRAAAHGRLTRIKCRCMCTMTWRVMSRLALSLVVGSLPTPSSAQELRPVPTAVWAPKPATTPTYPPGQKPWTRLTDLKAAHKGQTDWRELIVDDGRLTGEYVAAAPGARIAKRLHPDTREWFAVVEGDVRVEIEGQPPFTATRGSLVNIPRQTIYSLEAVGEKPSVRSHVNVAHAKRVFPRDGGEPPAQAAPAGTAWVAATLNRTAGQYDQFNQPHLNIHEAASHNE